MVAIVSQHVNQFTIRRGDNLFTFFSFLLELKCKVKA